MTSEVGNAQVPVFATFKGFRRGVVKEIEAAERDGSARFRKGFSKSSSAAGQDAGKGFRRGFSSATSDMAKTMQADVAKAARVVSASRLKEQDAAGKVRVAEAQLAEARAKYASDSSQVVRAEERLATVQRSLVAVQDVTKASTERLAAAQQRLAQATAQASKAGIGFAAFRTNVSNLLAPITALSKGVAGMASRAFTPLLQRVGEFTKRVTGPVRSAIGSAVSSMRDFGLNVAMRVVSPLAKAENVLRAKFAPQIDAVKKTLAPVGKAFQGAFGLARQAISGVGSVLGPVASGIGQAFATAMAGVKRVAGDAAEFVQSSFKVAGAAVAAALGAALVGGFGRLSAIETAQAKMRGLGFTAEDIAKAMDIANEAALGTAYSLDELAGAASMAMTAGVKPGEQLVGYLDAIKGAATASGTSVGEVASIFGKVRTEGRAYTLEIRQLADRQIPIWQALADEVGTTTDEVRNLATDGKISAETFEAAVRRATGGLAAEVGQTTASSARNARTALSKLGAVLLGGVYPAFKVVFDTIYSGLQGITRFVEPLAIAFGERLAGSVEVLSGKLQGFFSALKPAEAGVGAVAGIFGALLPLVGGLVGLLGPLTANIPILSSVFGGLTGPLGLVAGALVALFAFDPATLMAGFDALIPMITGAVSSLLGSLTSVLANVVPELIENFAANAPMFITAGVHLILGLVDAIVGALPGLLGAVVGIIPQLISALLGMLPQMMNAGLRLFSGLVEGVVAAVPMIVNSIVTLLPQLIDAIVGMLPRLIESGISLFLGLATALVTAIPQIVTALIGALPKILTAIVGAIPLLLQAGIRLFMGLVQSITTILPQLITAVVGLLPSIITALVEMIPTLLLAAVDLFIQLVKAIPVILPDLITSIIGMIPTIISALIGMIPTLITGAVELFMGIVKALPEIIPALLEAILGLGPAIVGALIEIVPQLFDAGKSIIQGLIDGVMSMFGAIGEAFGGVMDFIGGFFPHSPAKRGPFSGAGWRRVADGGSSLVEQFAAGAESAQSAFSLDVAASRVRNAARGVVTAAGSSVALPVGGGGRSINQTNNYSHEDPRVAAALARDQMDSLLRSA